MQKQIAAFVESIRKSGLLRPEHLETLAASANVPTCDPQVLAREIVQRGWLTPFQVKMFWKGQGAELFLGQYLLVDRLGEGGMGEVFKARHRRMERDVALKVIRKKHLDSTDAIRRFEREIQAAAQLAHENIVMAYDADKAEDRHFFAMEFVDGSNLTRLVKDKGPLPVVQACDCIRQTALGLQHAFERGMVHRDIKPSNLLLNKGGVVKILDMGLARLYESPSGEVESRITQEGLVIGTPDFLSPEQARNARTADIRSDIYSLGCTFYFLLCGHPPYQGGTPTEKLLRHTVDPTPVPTRPDVPAPLVAIMQKMMAKRVDDRYQTPAEIARVLEPFLPSTTSNSGLQARPGARAAHSFTPPPTPLPSQAPLLPLSLPIDDTRTESQFHLPAPTPLKKPKPERTRWNVPIAVAAGVLALGVASALIYALVTRKNQNAATTLDPEYTNRHDMIFKLIPAGTFEMGSSETEAGRSDDEGPVHTVEITRAFYLMTTEVTLRHFKSVVGRLPKEWKEEPDDLDVPATKVSYREASAFCERLNKDPGARKNGWFYRLPTEAEWEYACRAGSKTRFNVGNDLGTMNGLFGEPITRTPARTAQFSPNAWGLYDMHGNAAEWVNDLYDERFYTNSPAQDPAGPQARGKFVVRGGSVNSPAEQCRSASRSALYPETALPSLGFRVALVQSSKR